jgi:hypothetical protein
MFAREEVCGILHKIVPSHSQLDALVQSGIQFSASPIAVVKLGPSLPLARDI